MNYQVFDSLAFDVVLRPGTTTIVAPDNGTSSSSESSSTQNSQIQTDVNFEFRDNLIRYETAVQYQQGSDRKLGENILLKARIWDDQTEEFITRSDVEAITADLFRVSAYTFNARVWTQDDNWKDIIVPTTTLAVSPSGTWKYDSSEFNFVWIPDQTDRALPVDGSFAIRLTFSLTGGRLPIRVSFMVD